MAAVENPPTQLPESIETQAEPIQQSHKKSEIDESIKQNKQAENTESQAENGVNEKPPEPEHAKDDDNLRKDGTPRKYGGHGRKSNLTSQEQSSDPIAIRQQVEFYFSDSNLPTDKYLFNLVGGTQNHPIELESICSFQRMRRFQPFQAVVDALQDSQTMNVFQGDEKKWMVQRKAPLPEAIGSKSQYEARRVYELAALARSVYVKGFGLEQPSTQFDIEAFFADFGHTNAVRLRRVDDKTFKGSVFVEFESEEKAQEFLQLDPAPAYHGNPLIIKSKKKYLEEKQRASRKSTNNEQDWRQRRDDDKKHGRLNYRNHRGGRNQRDQRSNDPRNKRSRDESAADQSEEPAPKKVETESSAAAPDGDEVLADVPKLETADPKTNGEEATKAKEGSGSKSVKET